MYETKKKFLNLPFYFENFFESRDLEKFNLRNGEIVEILSIEDMRAGKTAHDYTMQLLNASANRVATMAAD